MQSMNTEKTNSVEEEPSPARLTRRGKIVAGIAGVGLTLAGGVMTYEANNSPHMSGEQVVTVEPGDRLDSLIKADVEGGASHTGDVRAEVIGNPANAKTLENNLLDLGEKLVLPKKVD